MKIFEPFSLGEITLNNKIVMAPMTRCRAIGNVPNALMTEYYSRRASTGLIITEGTAPSINGLGYARIPGAYTDEQINGWESIATGVHANEGKIFVQLMHTGRVSTSLNLPEGGITMAPSAIPLDAIEMYTDEKGMQPHDVPVEMSLEQIAATQEEFVNSSIKLVEAGIDGIELHSANGYLLDQFLNPKTNTRTDEYGGNFKNRARFVVEIAQKVVAAVGANKVGIRFSPYGAFNDLESHFEDVVELYTYLAEEMNTLGLAYIHIVDQRVAMNAPEFGSDIRKTIREHFNGALIGGGDIHEANQAEAKLDEGYDLVYVGRPLISNPTFVEKIKKGEALTPVDPDTFYSADTQGYLDYN
ncbi:alkene reductase [Spongiimicrobium salis]|uniref:alkene reductase n=1 Tax=Spongiimicrobium salis TaxID=1667022 RepID=UPI00374C9F38